MTTQVVAATAVTASVPSLHPAKKSKTTATTKPERLPTTVENPIPYAYDFVHLLATDPNPLPLSKTLLSNPPTTTNEIFKSIARDGAQSLLNTLLTDCPIIPTPDGPRINLPSTVSNNPLPRRLPLPKPKPPTKWERFARKKGIGKFGGNSKGGAVREERRKNMVYDETSGEWVKKWGFGGKRQRGEQEWLVELDDKKVRTEKGLDDGKTIRGEGKRERMERVRRQERRERSNQAKAGKGGRGAE